MANKKDTKPQEADLDLTEPIPEDLGGDGEEQQNYLPATRQGMGLTSPGEPIVLDMDGVRPPFLSLVHGTSKELAERFNVGDLVLKKEVAVCKRGEKLQAVILALDTYYKERLGQDAWAAGTRPRTFKTLKDAEEAGLNTKWDDKLGLKPEVSAAMDLVMLIRRNEGVSDGLFGVDIGIQDAGKPTDWGFALLSLDKGGSKVFKNDIALVVNNRLRSTGLYSGLWELNTELAPASPKSANRPFVIRARFKGILDPAAVENIRSAMSVPVSDGPAGDEFP